jgi:hypothetical protein
VEKISAVRQRPDWMQSFGTHIAESKEKAIQGETHSTTRTRIYSDGSDIDGGGRAAAVLYRSGVQMRTL